MFLSEWREFPSAPCIAGKVLMTARVSMLLKSHASLTCFRACFLPGQAKDLSAPRGTLPCSTFCWQIKVCSDTCQRCAEIRSYSHHMINMLSFPEIGKWRKVFLSKILLHVKEEVAHGNLWNWACKALDRDSRKTLRQCNTYVTDDGIKICKLWANI